MELVKMKQIISSNQNYSQLFFLLSNLWTFGSLTASSNGNPLVHMHWTALNTIQWWYEQELAWPLVMCFFSNLHLFFYHFHDPIAISIWWQCTAWYCEVYQYLSGFHYDGCYSIVFFFDPLIFNYPSHKQFFAMHYCIGFLQLIHIIHMRTHTHTHTHMRAHAHTRASKFGVPRPISWYYPRVITPFFLVPYLGRWVREEKCRILSVMWCVPRTYYLTPPWVITSVTIIAHL